LTLESWPLVGLFRLPLPVAGAQLALTEPNVRDQLRAIGARGETSRAFPISCNVNASDLHDCFTTIPAGRFAQLAAIDRRRGEWVK
jgi:hypothetical protein